MPHDPGAIPLREYIEKRFDELQKNSDRSHVALEQRLESMNEFREQLRSQAVTFMTREVYDANHKLLQAQVDELKLNRALLDGKASQQDLTLANTRASVGIGIGVLSLAVAIIKLLGL